LVGDVQAPADVQTLIEYGEWDLQFTGCAG
jgi:hypothetical protein